MKLKQFYIIFIIAFFSLALLSNCKPAKEGAGKTTTAVKLAQVTFKTGTVTAEIIGQAETGKHVRNINPGDVLSTGDILKTGEKASVEILVKGQGIIRIAEIRK